MVHLRKTIVVLFCTALILAPIIYVFASGVKLETCGKSENYFEKDETIYDENKLDTDDDEIVQDAVMGRFRKCTDYLKNKTYKKYEKQAVPKIIKKGIKRFKDQDLLNLAYSLNFDNFTEKEPVAIYYVDGYEEDPEKNGEYNHDLKNITIKRGNSPRVTKAALAHEYLHYIWDRDKLGKDERLISELVAFYKDSPDLRQYMKNYTSETANPTEFFSFGCTEWTDRRLTAYILEKCNQYIDRTKMPIFF